MSSLYTLPGHLIRRLQQIAVALFAARMAEAGLDLTPVQYAALSTIHDNPGVDQATLAGLIAYDRVTLGVWWSGWSRRAWSGVRSVHGIVVRERFG